MQVIAPLAPLVSTLAVATIYCLWYRANQVYARRRQKLRERVAYMLWVAATEVP